MLFPPVRSFIGRRYFWIAGEAYIAVRSKGASGIYQTRDPRGEVLGPGPSTGKHPQVEAADK